jgi:hypothetical protein
LGGFARSVYKAIYNPRPGSSPARARSDTELP